MVFLESFYTFLLIAHLLGTFVLMGSLVHNLFVVLDYVKGKFGRKKREIYYLKYALWSYVVVYVFGAVIYPAFGVYIRRPFFDNAMPWATGLFEVKEHWAAVGLALMFVYYYLRKSFDPQDEKHKLALYVPLCLIVNVITWYVVIAGCYLSLLKGTWQ